MTIFGLNSPELFVLLIILLVILGIKRIEKGLELFSRLLKFLLSNQSSFEETQKKEEEIKKKEEKSKAKEKESIKVIEETQKKEEEIKQTLKISNVDNNNESKTTKIKDPKGRIENDKTSSNSESINMQEEQIENK